LGGGYIVSTGSVTSVGITNLQPATLYYAYAHAYADGTYPTSSSYELNSRNYYTSGGYGFYTMNYYPTINSLSDITLCQNAGQQLVSLFGISDGSTLENQTVSVSATSSNPSLIPTPTISYANPNSYGYLFFTPVAGQSGTSVITVTANDGWFTTNTTSVSFTVTVKAIPGTLGMISGSNPVCAGSTNSYTVAAGTNTTGYTWSVPSTYTITSGQGTQTITVATSTNTPSGSFTVYGTNSNGCGNGPTNSQSIQVDVQPTTADAGPDQPLICSGTAFLNATAAGSGCNGSWSWLSGTPTPSLGSPSSNSTSISGLTSPQTYQYIWTVTRPGSVCPDKKDTVSVTTNWANIACTPAANFSFSPVSDVSSTSVCVGSTITFTDLSVSANSWNWDFNYNGSLPNFTDNAQNPSHTYNTVGTYTVYLRIHSNATGLDYNITKPITVIDIPAVPGTISGTTSAPNFCAGSAPLQFNYNITSVTNATNYTWTVPTGANIVGSPSPNFIVVEFTSAAQPGNITVSSTNSCGMSAANSLMINLIPLPSAPGPISGPGSVCQGQTTVSYTVPTISGATSYSWMWLDGTVSTTATPTQTFNVGVNEQNGEVYVKGVNTCGFGDSTNIPLIVNPLPGNAGAITGTSFLQLCPTATNVSYTIDSVANATGYTWLVSQGMVSSGTGTDSITVDFTGVNAPTTIQVIPSNSCGVRDSSSIYMVDFNSLPTVDVCIATVDSISQYNEVYWVRPASSDIDSFRVYRRISALVDTLIGTVAYEDESYIVDTLSDYDPNSSLEQYTISAIDSCGNEGVKAPYHTTMFLATSFGSGTVNLQWNLYIGQTVNFYKVYRDSFAVGGNWDLLDGMVNPTATAWVDNNPVPGGRYRIEVDWLTTCDPTRGAINTSRSNIKSPNAVGLKDLQDNGEIKLFPNPANSQVTLAMSKKGCSAVQVVDALGRIVHSNMIDAQSASYTFNVDTFAKGVYTVIASGPNGKFTKKLIVE
jgi:hypothetical protein